MTFVSLDRFRINLKDRVGRTISYPKFDLPMKFVVEKVGVVEHMPNCFPPSYQHGEVNF